MPDWIEAFDWNRLWQPPDERGADEARFIKKALHLRQGHTVLDAPCGTGRIAIHLARAGCIVTGVDLQERFIKHARGQFREAGLKGRFLVMDVREMDMENVFHGISNWFGSFGYFSDEKNLDVLRRYARALRPGGRILIDQINREKVLRHFTPQEHTIGNVSAHYSYDAATQRINARYSVDGLHDPCNTYYERLYTPTQMAGLFEQAGLTVEQMYGSLDAEAFRRSSRRMITVGSKGGQTWAIGSNG